MSSAIAQSATQLSISTPSELDLVEMVQRNAVRAIKNPSRVSTTERFTLNNSKLLNACRMEWRSKNGGVGRVPDEVDIVIQDNVNKFIMAQVNRINPANAMSFNVRDVLDFKNLCITEKVTAVGSNTKTLQSQYEACNRLIRETQDKLDNYVKQDASGNSKKDYAELIKNAKKRLAELELTKNHIKATLAEVGKVTPAE